MLRDKVHGVKRQAGHRHRVAPKAKPLESGLCPVCCGLVVSVTLPADVDGQLEIGDWSHWGDPDEECAEPDLQQGR